MLGRRRHSRERLARRRSQRLPDLHRPVLLRSVDHDRAHRRFRDDLARAACVRRSSRSRRATRSRGSSANGSPMRRSALIVTAGRRCRPSRTIRPTCISDVAPGASRLLDAPEFDTLGVVRTENGELNESRFAVPAGRVSLRNDLNERLLKLDSDRLHNIRSASSDKLQSGCGRWQAACAERERAALSARHCRRSRVGFDADWAPFSYVDSNGHASGIAAAYLAYLSKMLGVTFDRRAYADSSAVVAGVRSPRRRHDPHRRAGSRTDLHGGIPTEPHDRYPLVIVGRHGQAAVKSLDDLPRAARLSRANVSRRTASLVEPRAARRSSSSCET